MLVARFRKPRRKADETGSTLIMTVAAMLLLVLFATTLAALVTTTASGLAATRSTVESRAAADAGVAALVAHARRTNEFCGLSDDDIERVAGGADFTLLEEEGTRECKDDEVTFLVEGRGSGGAVSRIRATFAYAESSVPVGSAELVFFNSGSESVYFTNHVFAESEGLATILFPGGGLFECKATVPANIITTGSFLGQSGCIVNGGVYAGGSNPASGTWAVYLNNDDQVLGSVTAIGNVSIGGGNSKIGGTLTLPTSANLQIAWTNVTASKPTANTRVKGGQAGGIQWSATLEKPKLDPWFEYAHSDSKWPGYAKVKITTTSSPYKCSNINAWDTTFWSSYIQGITTPTVIDLQDCADGISTGSIRDDLDQAKVGANIAFIARKFRLSDFELTPKSGTDPSVWFVVPDPTNDGKPSCSGTAGTIETDAKINILVQAMAYTPCTIRVGYGGVWTGAMYSGSLDDGGDIRIYTKSMGLPGQWGAAIGSPGGASIKSLGGLLSQRDVPVP